MEILISLKANGSSQVTNLLVEFNKWVLIQ